MMSIYRHPFQWRIKFSDAAKRNFIFKTLSKKLLKCIKTDKINNIKYICVGLPDKDKITTVNNIYGSDNIIIMYMN